MENNTKKLKLRLLISAVAVTVAVAAAASSTFAWLAISRTPIVADLGLTVLTDSRLEIAPDVDGQPGEWELSLDLSDLLRDLAPLRPVTFSKVNQALYTTLYDTDGRNTGKTVALSDAMHANIKATDSPVDSTGYGYYIAIPFWIRGIQNADVSLAPALEVSEGRAGSGTYLLGNPTWNEEAGAHVNGARGLETAIRIGFRYAVTDLDGRVISDYNFKVYEPNCDSHVNTDSAEYIDTISIDGGSLCDPENLVRQTASHWTETDPALADEVIYALGDFKDSAKVFRVTTSTMVKVTMYIWLEGRDVDCVNVASSLEASILGNIQLTADGGYDDPPIGRD